MADVIYTGASGFEVYEPEFAQQPQLVSATTQNSNTVRIVFDKAMKHVSASNSDDCLNTSNYVITNDPIALTVSSVAHVSGDTTFDLTVNEMDGDVTYTLTVSNVEDSVDELVIDPAHDDDTFSGSGVKPRVSSAVAKSNKLDVEVHFNETMKDDAELVDTSNYTFSGGLTASSVTASAGFDYVTIRLANIMANEVTYTVTVSTDVEDAAGNTLDPNYTEATFATSFEKRNVYFMYDDKLEDITPTASSAKSAYPVTNVVNDTLSKPWRSDTALTTEDPWIKFDMASTKKFNSLALLNTNLTNGAYVIAQANDTDSWTSPSYQQRMYLDERDPNFNLLGSWFKDMHVLDDFSINKNDLSQPNDSYYSNITTVADTEVGTRVYIPENYPLVLGNYSSYTGDDAEDFNFGSTDGFVIEGWFKSTNSGDFYIASKSDGTANSGWDVFCDVTNTTLRFRTFNGGTIRQGTIPFSDLYNADANDGLWHYFRAYRGSSICGISADNEFGVIDTNANVDVDSDKSLILGGGVDGADDINGHMSGIKIKKLEQNVKNVYLITEPLQRFRYIRFLICDPANPDGYVQIGKAVAGYGYDMDQGFDNAYEKVTAHNVLGQATNYNEAKTFTRDKRLAFNISFTNATKFFRNEMQEMFNFVQGGSKPLLFIPNIHAEHLGYNYEPSCYYGRLQNEMVYSHKYSRFIFNNIQIVEEGIGLTI